jgi:hypothetical protein
MRLFKKKNVSEIKPMGVKTTVERPFQSINRISDEDLQKLKKDFNNRLEKQFVVDPYFLQDISDRLYGPDSKSYIDALKELNEKFRPRAGRTGYDIFRDDK